MNKMASSGVSLLEDDYFPGKYEDVYATPQADMQYIVPPITASLILHLNRISIITTCHVVYILLNHRRNSVLNGSLAGLFCFESNFRVFAQK